MKEKRREAARNALTFHPNLYSSPSSFSFHSFSLHLQWSTNSQLVSISLTSHNERLAVLFSFYHSLKKTKLRLLLSFLSFNIPIHRDKSLSHFLPSTPRRTPSDSSIAPCYPPFPSLSLHTANRPNSFSQL
jgi:hypothetical protein